MSVVFREVVEREPFGRHDTIPAERRTEAMSRGGGAMSRGAMSGNEQLRISLLRGYGEGTSMTMLASIVGGGLIAWLMRQLVADV